MKNCNVTQFFFDESQSFKQLIYFKCMCIVELHMKYHFLQIIGFIKKQDKEHDSNNILSSRKYFHLFLGQTNHEIIAKWYIVMFRITKNLQNQTIVGTSHIIFMST